MDEPFKNREILEMFRDVKEGLAAIETQTTRHNGRMTNIERWQYVFMGGMGVLTVVVVPLLGWAMYVLSNIHEIVDTAAKTAVTQALIPYDLIPDNK